MREPPYSMDGADGMVAEHLLRVRFGECDPMGIVYHPHYLVWFHEARDALLAGLGIDLAALSRLGYRFPVSEISCRYLHPAGYGDSVRVVTRARALRVARMHFHFEAQQVQSRRTLARAEAVLVITDAAGRLLLRPPPELQQLIKGTALEPAVESGKAAP